MNFLQFAINSIKIRRKLASVAFSFRGRGLPPDPLTRGSAPESRWGQSPQTSIGSRYRARHTQQPRFRLPVYSRGAPLWVAYLRTYRYIVCNDIGLMRFAMADDARDGLIDGDVAGNNLSTTTTTYRVFQKKYPP